MQFYKHQTEALNLTENFNKCAYYLDMGLGKTFVGAEKSVRLDSQYILIICQKSKIQDWFEHFDKYYDCRLYDLTKKKDLFNYMNDAVHSKVPSVGIINYELAFRRSELLELEHFTLMLDESSMIQNDTNKRTKFILKMHPDNVILLSGTPTSGKYENLWSQMNLLGWNISKELYNKHYVNWTKIESDGFIHAPYISIKDEIIAKGRMKPERKFAWEVFKDVVEELEKKDNSFKTIVVDLLEDLYEHCRVYMCNQMGISHESDDSFKAWDKVRSEFLNTIKRLVNLDYENILFLSHEDTSRDITKKGGDKTTAIKPNLQDKVANKIAGMVDIVARCIADDTNRTLSFKTSEVVFGGGRLLVSENSIPLNVDELFAVYDEANKNAVATLNGETVQTASTGRRSRKKTETPTETDVAAEVQEAENADVENV